LQGKKGEATHQLLSPPGGVGKREWGAEFFLHLFCEGAWNAGGLEKEEGRDDFSRPVLAECL